MKFLQFPIIVVFILFSCKTSAPTVSSSKPYQIVKQAYSDKAMVVSAHPEASEVGLQIIKQGGNAVDAAIAVQFALAVVYPVAGNIGGGGFMVLRNQDGEVNAIDFREKAPAFAHRDMYLDANGNVIKGQSLAGHLAAGVPGTVDGMELAFIKYSKLRDWKALLAPAIKLAKDGFKLTESQANGLHRSKDVFIKHNTVNPAFVKDASWSTGEVLKQPELANTLIRIRDQGRDGFYQGKTAQLVVEEMERGGGIMTLDDLKNYRATWRQPLTTEYKGHRIISMPPASSGGVALIQLLEIVEPYPLDQWGHHHPNSVHVMIEAERRVYADRAKHLGDMDYYPVPVEKLISAHYIDGRRAEINMERATSSDEILAGEFIDSESEETTHFSVVDDQGNAVSVTTTINTGYGSKTVVGGAGFLLNNEMDDFSIKPGVPNVFGLIGGEANAIEGGKRMLSSMTPTIIEKDGELKMVVGTPGGSTIITSVFQTILNVIDHGMNMQEAVSAKRFHHQWKPEQVFTEEAAFSDQTISSLQKIGHEIKPRGNIGRVEAILVTAGKLEGAADPRGDDHAAGWQ
jgi:gamma-glutamyltranspeptidase/glutathione hydrolase